MRNVLLRRGEVRLSRATGLKQGGEIKRATPFRRSRMPSDAPVKSRRAPRDTGPSQAMRLKILKRDGYQCARCGKPVIDVLRSIHHRKRRSQGGKSTPDNLVLVCGDGVLGCHGHVHRNPEQSYDLGWLVREGDDPALKPLTHVRDDGSRLREWLGPDGRRTTEAPEGADEA